MLGELLKPKSIAIVGASSKPGKVGHALLANLIASGYAGTIVPVTGPGVGSILGVPCVESLRKSRRRVELSIVAVRKELVKQCVEDSLAAGAKAIVVISAGFRETGADGLERERELVELFRAKGARLLGPNCVGVLNTHHCMNATFAPAMPVAGPIAVISQSGALCVAILDWAAQRGLGLSKVISLGNKADLTSADLLEALASDGKTKVIAAYLESIQDGPRFLAVAERTARRKPVVVLKAGITATGTKAASSHTGSLAGLDIAYDAAFRRSGLVRAENLEQLFEFAQVLAMQPLPRGNRLGILTNAGGCGILAADAAENLGLSIPELPTAVRERLAKVLPAAAALANPVDVIGDADPDRFIAAFEILQEADEVAGILVLATPQNMTRPLELARRLAETHQRKKTLLTAFIGGESVAEAIRFLAEAGIPNYPSPEAAVAAFDAACRYASWREQPQRVVTQFRVNQNRVERVLKKQIRMGIPQMSEVEAKEILAAYGFKTLPGGFASNAEEAASIGERIGFPVALKVVSPDVIHKSDFGGVRLNLTDADAVIDAHDLIRARLARDVPAARIRGFYVERMGRRGREVILGMTRDPQFGPMLMFGLGGIFVEVMKDVSFSLSPVTANEAMQMLKSTRSYALLRGARGEKEIDLSGIVDGIMRLSQLASDYPQIKELDINPFIVTDAPGEAYVADARLTIDLLGESRKR